jgi:hypothetical protein
MGLGRLKTQARSRRSIIPISLPSQRLQTLGEREHADPAHLRLLRPCRERPCRYAAKRDNELPPSNMDCHVTLPRGSCNGGDHITPSRAALRNFDPAYVRLGSTPAVSTTPALGPLHLSDPTSLLHVGNVAFVPIADFACEENARAA